MFKKIGLIFFGLVTLINASSKCPDIQDLKQHNGHYYGITTNTMTFDEAKKFAESKGGYIAIPNNAAENTFLKSILGGRKGGWIGVYDPSYSSNYSYSVGQKKNSSRFRDIKGNALSYAYWESSQPDNLIEEYDTYNGQQRVSPLGEHWVAMDGNSGKWWDYGNHYGIGKAKYYVLLEFDSVPICFEDLSSNVTDTFTNKKCSTQIWDNKTGNLETGTIFDCRTDSYGNTYCPSALSACGQNWDYDSGFSVGGLGQVVDYSDKTIVKTCKQADLQYSSCAPGYLWIGAATNYCANLTEGGYTDWRMPQLSETSASQSQGVPSCGENTITGTIRSAGYSYVWNNRTSGWGENAGIYGGWGWKVRCVR